MPTTSDPAVDALLDALPPERFIAEHEAARRAARPA
jgi:hypothetical protein